MVGHGKSGDVQRPGKMAHTTVRGTRHRSAIGGREEMQLQTHAAFARGIWDLVVLCVLWVGAAGCQEKKRYCGCFLPQIPFFALGPFAVMILILDSMHGLPFRIWMPEWAMDSIWQPQ